MSKRKKLSGRNFARSKHRKNVESFGNDVAIVILLILLIISVIWFLKEPGFEPLFTAVSVVGSIIGLVTAYFYRKKKLAVGILVFVLIASGIGVYRSFTAPDTTDVQQVITNSFNDYSQEITYFDTSEFTSEDVQRILQSGHEARRGMNLTIALNYYEIARDKAIEIGDKAGLASALINIGSINQRVGDYVLAEENYREAYWISYNEDYIEILAFTQESMGNLYVERRIFSSAVTSFQQAERLYGDIGDRLSEARMARLVGEAAFADKTGINFPYALDQYKRALEIFRELGNQTEVARTLALMGDYYAEYNSVVSNHEVFGLNDSFEPSNSNDIKAIEYYQLSLETSRQVARWPDDEVINQFKNTSISGLGYGALFKLEEALILEKMGDVYLRVGMKDEAHDAYNEAHFLWLHGTDGGETLDKQLEVLWNKIVQSSNVEVQEGGGAETTP